MRVSIRVQPNSSRQQIQTNIDGEIQKVFLKNVAKDNKANKELEKLLSKHYGAKAKIVKGHTSKNKIVEVNE